MGFFCKIFYGSGYKFFVRFKYMGNLIFKKFYNPGAGIKTFNNKYVHIPV